MKLPTTGRDEPWWSCLTAKEPEKSPIFERSRVTGKNQGSGFLDDVEVVGVQLRLENAIQGDGVVSIDGDDSVPMTIVVRCV